MFLIPKHVFLSSSYLRLMTIIFVTSLLFQEYISFNAYSKLMKILTGASFLFQSMFLLQHFCNKYANAFWSIPPLPKNVLFLHLWWKSLLKHLSSSQAYFIFSSYSKLMNILSEELLLFQSMFLIRFLFNIDANSFLKYPSSSKARFLFNPQS